MIHKCIWKQYIYNFDGSEKISRILVFTCNRNPVRIFIRNDIKASGQQQKNGVQTHSPARLNTWQQKHGQQKYAQQPEKNTKQKSKDSSRKYKIFMWNK